MQPTDPRPAPSTSPRSGPEMMTMTETQQTLTDRIDAALKATEGHTPGPWYGEDQPRTWQLFARRVEPWPDGTPIDLRDDSPEGMELHPLQILKAPKKGTPFAEYWPEPADAALIAAAPDLRALLTDALAELRAQAEALAKVRGVLGNVLDEAYDGQHSYRVDLSTLRAAYETLGAHQ